MHNFDDIIILKKSLKDIQILSPVGLVPPQLKERMSRYLCPLHYVSFCINYDFILFQSLVKNKHIWPGMLFWGDECLISTAYTVCQSLCPSIFMTLFDTPKLNVYVSPFITRDLFHLFISTAKNISRKSTRQCIPNFRPFRLS